ncbi:MAG TPA: formyltetrahydrofolate deformylase [Candidatus Limnocylindria bacterium]|nr:formyltetrahydrofolate deformylase [Candidatus Limnocylindria bacterium]
MSRYVLTLSCQDRPGIVHAVTGALLSVSGNITESAQFNDAETGLFVLRTAFDAETEDVDSVRGALGAQEPLVGADVEVRLESDLCRVLVLVSKFDHCLVDLLYRWNAGDLPIEIVGVVSNHDDCRPIAERYGLAYHHAPVTAETKQAAEAELLRLVADTGADLLVLARYMQVLSDETCRALRGRAINIHHSFLPGFKGARPYHQAHARGVKLIGATAHYVTADLDEGPIIEQDVVRVGHVETAERLAAVGRDVERRVLSEAVRVHAERRVFLSGSRTVVF